jgi:hypothetical protein
MFRSGMVFGFGLSHYQLPITHYLFMGLPRMISNGIRFGVLALCFSAVLTVTGLIAFSLITGKKAEVSPTPAELAVNTAPPQIADTAPSLPTPVPSEVPNTQYPLLTTISPYLPQYLYVSKPFTQIGGAIGGILNILLDSLSIDVKNLVLKSSTSLDISGSLVDIGDGKYNRANGDKDLGVAGDFEARGNAEIAGTLYIGTDSGSGDDKLYFDDGASQYMMWDDDPGRFYLSNGLEISGDMRIGTGLIGNTDYLYFDDGSSQYLAWDDLNLPSQMILLPPPMTHLILGQLIKNGEIYTLMEQHILIL